jgi:chorismate mutase
MLRDGGNGRGLAMDNSDKLAQLDQHFVDIYEAARANVVERQKQVALIVIDNDDLLLYRHGCALERFPGLMPPLYNKMKTLGHMPLGVFCLVYDHADEQLSGERLAQISSYRDAIEAAAGELDTREDAGAGILPNPSEIYPKVTAFLDAVIAKGSVSGEDLAAFARSVAADIESVLGAAARAQLDACNAITAHIRKDLLTQEQWNGLRVLVLGPYMAKQGEIFLQYFARALDTPEQGDKRVVYFDGDDLRAAMDRLGTTMLDAVASQAVFGEVERLHRDVLADATTQYLKSFAET